VSGKRNRTRGLTTQRIPTPNEIADVPELAILHALDEILDLAPRVLVAAHPELADPDAPYWVRETSSTTRTADDIVAAAHRLQRHIRAYRRAISLARDLRCEADPEIPF